LSETTRNSPASSARADTFSVAISWNEPSTFFFCVEVSTSPQFSFSLTRRTLVAWSS
jgi:hypothetical protein